MNELLSAESSGPTLLGVVAVIVLAIFFFIRYRRRRAPTLESVFKSIAFERLDGLVIPAVDDGEIQIDHLLLTAQGLLIVDVKDVHGAVFGSDKMDPWTVISENKRFTFRNPQPALYERVAAVRQIVRQVPVAGKVVFLDGAHFAKGVPSLAVTLDELQVEFGDWDEDAAKIKIEAFKPYWETLRLRASI